MKKKWKKLMATWCAVVMLMTMPGVCVLADEIQEETIVTEAEVPEESVNSVDSPYEDATEVAEETIRLYEVEEVVGEVSIQVGDGVTATFNEETGEVEFTSQDGTLWSNWVNNLGVSRDDIISIKVVSGTVYLPADSSGDGYDANGKYCYQMFGGLPELKSIDLSSFDTSNVRNMEKMFLECRSLTELDLSNFVTSNVTNMSFMFDGCKSLTNLNLSRFNTSKVMYMDGMFYYCHSLKDLNLSSFDTSNVRDMNRMFDSCSSLKGLDLSRFNTSKVTSMYGMFEDSSRLTSLNLSSFDTSKVTAMYSMFNGCSSLQNLNLSSFNTSNVEGMQGMFYRCSSLTKLDLSGFDTSNVTSMEAMFRECSRLTNLDLSSFNTSKVTDMSTMFHHCSMLKNLDVSSFDTSNVRKMGYDTSAGLGMFSGCSSLTDLDLSSFDTSNITFMRYMFMDCSSLTDLDLSSFDTSNVTDMMGMFSGCSSLTSLNLNSFDTSNVVWIDDMFKGCSALNLLKTPKNNEIRAELPVVMLDDAGNEYEELPVLSESIVLTRNKPTPQTDISDFIITLSVTSYTYDGKAKEPTVTVKNGSITLIAGKDYIFNYANNTNVGTATVKVEGIGNYKGEMIATFKITEPTAFGFSDVQDPTHPYYNAIYWAADEGITKGYSDGTFGINRSCTRGEMMMFLWKYARKPEPKAASKSPFKDVPKTNAFYKAILWGYQKEITKGYSDGSFGINRNVSRGEAMMFLWKLKGKPAPKAVTKSPFKDVPKTHVFYKAILWGSQKGITKGYTSGVNKGKFGINDNCTRGQIVTFLYRARK